MKVCAECRSWEDDGTGIDFGACRFPLPEWLMILFAHHNPRMFGNCQLAETCSCFADKHGYVVQNVRSRDHD
jgi:hypothetical protein